MTQKNPNKPIIPCPAIRLIPHRHPMLLIDLLTERSDDRITAAAVSEIKSKYFFQNQGTMPCTEFFIEIIAQTIAAARGFDGLLDDEEPKTGLLVGLDEFIFDNKQTLASQLESHVREIFKFGEITLFEGKLFSGQSQIAAGKIQVWEKSET